MKKLFLPVLLTVLSLTAYGAELILFENGKLAGKFASKAEIKNGKLRFSTSQAPKLKLVPPTPDLSKYARLEMILTANRGGDQFRLTFTSNPAGAAKWNYYCLPGKFTFAKGNQKMTFDLTKLLKSRQPLGKNQIQTIDFNFSGWEMPYKKGLILDIEKIVLSGTVQASAKTSKEPVADKKKIAAEIKRLEILPDKPWIPVPDISNRKFWDAKLNTIFGKNVIKHAARGLNTPAAPPPTDYYLDFLRNGNRSRYEKAYNPVVQNYANLTMALCVTGDTKTYFKQWQAYNDVLCGMATWVYPAHDRKLDNLLMRRPHIELVGSNVAAIVATARRLLAPLISKETAARMEKAVKRQILDPFIETAQGKRHPDWFLVSNNNWNSVCIANVIQTLLASELPADVRRHAVAFGLLHLKNYLDGFTADGYCSEGISYWSYGFGHYLRLGALIYSVTKGKINLLDAPQSRLAASFPERFMMSEKHYYPAFSDCSFDAGLADVIVYMRDYLMGYETTDEKLIASNMLGQLAVYSLPPQNSKAAKKFVLEKVSAFSQTGVFLFRHPASNGLRLACKGGSNNEMHNHNDVGSYAIAFPGQHVVLGDLGGAVYTRDSFNSNRYKNPMLNSWGHPVPVIGGKLQTQGPGTEAKIIRFSNQKENAAVTLDIRNAYNDNPAIKKLTRAFDYSFAGRGKIIITDCAEFTSPQSFESALTTFGKITQSSKDKLMAEYRNCRLQISVNTGGIPWKLKREIIKADTRWKDTPVRYAVVLEGKHKKISVKFEITPADK